MRSFNLDASVRRTGGGRVLIGGSPLKLLRLTATGAALIDDIERGNDVGEPVSVARSQLIDRLLDAGIVHPHYGTGSPGAATAADVTIVVPTFHAAPAALEQLVAACAGSTVIVVDDASAPPVPALTGATVVTRATNGGPGAARTTGLSDVSTPFVAFVDADVELPPNWLPPLLAHFADPEVALVAPRVASAPGCGSTFHRYERTRSPLDLGAESARVRPGTRVSYVPSAAIVCRVEALTAVGGFDESLRFGEDVDLVWRMDEAGWRVRYDPSVVVRHQPRSMLRAGLRQRFSYGSSAAPLAARHPGALAPVRVSGWSALSWLCAALGRPAIGGAIATVTTCLLVRKLKDVPDGPREAVRLAGLGHLFAGRSLAAACTRAWWPLLIVPAALSLRVRRALLAAVLVPPLFDWVRTRPGVDVARYVALRTLDDAAYGAGVMVGAITARSADALRPDFTSWPKSAPVRVAPPVPPSPSAA